jgi:cytochrome b pre-mRNA-processing protein 3
MILKLFRPAPPDDTTIARLYGTIVARARTPPFANSMGCRIRYGVPDTVGGRLEMIMLHLVLVLRHLERERPPSAPSVRDCLTRSAGTWMTTSVR